MPIYSGVGGVMRESIGLDVCVGGIVREALVGYAGVDGVARSIIGLEDRIEHFYIGTGEIEVYDTSSGEDVLIGTDLVTAGKNGCSFSVIEGNGDITIKVSSRMVNRAILVSAIPIYAVFKDGHERTLASFAGILNSDIASFSIPAISSQTLNTQGETYVRIEGNSLTSPDSYVITEIKTGGTFLYARLDAGTIAERTVTLTGGVNINGKTIPII